MAEDKIEPGKRSYKRIFTSQRDIGTGKFLPGNPGGGNLGKKRSWTNAEWYQEMLSATAIEMTITVTQDNPKDNAGPITRTRNINVKSTKDFRTVIFAVLLNQVIENGDVPAARELLNRAEAVPKDQIPKRIPNPFDEMDDEEIWEYIKEIQERKIIPLPVAQHS